MLRVKVQPAAWVVWAICDETWPNALPIGYVIRPKSIDDPNRQNPLRIVHDCSVTSDCIEFGQT